MALVLKDRVKETTTTIGTGTYTLAGAVAGFEAFSEIGNSNTTYYCCTDGTDFEVGIGTYTASGTTLSRSDANVLQSSNSDNRVNWGAGTKTIFCTQPADKAVFLNADGDIELDFAHRILITGNASDPVLAIAGGGPNFIRFHDAVGFSSTTNAVDIVYRTTPNDLLIERASGENIAEFGGDDGHAALYFNDSKKLETVSGGIDVTGEIAATSLDISGDVDVDGTLEADNITLNGTSLAASATTDTTNASNIGSGTLANARLDQQLQDVAGLAVTNGNFIVGDGSNFVAESGSTARASLGLGTASVLDTGISNTNVPKFTSGVADNDFLRVDGTAIEGRSASQVLSDIGGQASLTFGISNTNAVKIDSSSVADDEFARFTANGLESRSTSEVRSDLGLAASATTDTTDASNISSGTLPNARLDAQLQDVAGLAVTNGNFIVGDGSNFVAESGSTARASLGLGTAAVLDTGISNTNVPKFTSGVADNDFLRVDGTAIEGRSASQVLSDIGGQASLTFGISNTNAVKIDSSSVADDEYARFTANGLESRSTSEVLSDIGGQASLTFGISNTNAVKIDSTSVADDEFARFTANGLESRSASEVRSDLSLVASATTDTTNASNIGSGTLPNARLDAQLQDVAGLAVTNGGFIVGDGSNFVLETGSTARTSLGLGSIATQASNNVSITGGSVSGITDLAIADGGTGASSASAARTNLGLGTAAVAATGISNGNVPVFTSGVADNDFLRVNGTSIEGRSASELASDIGASTTDEATALAIALG